MRWRCNSLSRPIQSDDEPVREHESLGVAAVHLGVDVQQHAHIEHPVVDQVGGALPAGEGRHAAGVRHGIYPQHCGQGREDGGVWRRGRGAGHGRVAVPQLAALRRAFVPQHEGTLAIRQREWDFCLIRICRYHRSLFYKKGRKLYHSRLIWVLLTSFRCLRISRSLCRWSDPVPARSRARAGG